MALPVIPADEADLTPYLQEGAESSLLLCGLLTIGQTEYAPFILFPTEESISAGPKAKILDGWKMMTSTPSNISQRYVTIGGQQIPICSPENADNQRGLLVVGSNKKDYNASLPTTIPSGIESLLYHMLPQLKLAGRPARASRSVFPISLTSLEGIYPTEPQLPAPWDLPQPLPGQAPAEWAHLALQRHYEQGLELLDQLQQGAMQSAHISQAQLEELTFPLAQMINQQRRLLQEYSTSRHST